MSGFTIYPAIDLRHGEVIRLRQGDPEQQKTYSQDPEAVAQDWLDAGAKWLHVVNLDGAFGENTGANLLALKDIIRICGHQAQVQFGGGLRDEDALLSVMSLGISRAILGTAAVEDLDFVSRTVQTFSGSRIAIGLDAQDGYLMTRGWQQKSEVRLDDFARNLADLGIQTIIYTNIARDGMGSGIDLDNTVALAQLTGLQVIASGGVASLEDVRAVKNAGLHGVIIGRALYEGQVDLREALAC